MRILLINKFFYRRRGAETYLFDLKALLERNGHEVAVFSMVHPENEPSPWNQYFVSSVDYSNKNIKAAARMFWSREAQRKLDALLDVFQPDIAHIQNIYHQLSPSILTTLKKRHIPIVLTLHDYKLICPNYEMYTEQAVCMRCKGHRYYNAVLHNCLKGSKALSALAMLEMYLHKSMQVYEKNVDCFVSPSQFLKQQLIDWRERVKRIEVLPNFIASPPVLTDLGHDVFYAGSLTAIKGVDLLLDNFRENQYGCRLLLAGSGPLQAESNDSIQFLGQLNKEQLANRMRQSRVVVVSSRHHENFPYTVLEAFAAGKPVIGSRRGGIPELVQDGKTGWLFEPTKPASLTAALTQALADDQRIVTYGHNAYQLATTQYTPDKHYEALLSIYQSLIA
ncbi:MAG: glycosyltransferase family 4 protein [Candidatus Kerfeldbacteria bacterium]|nr:glycosyltransferase family 4 protein [Candidatus Kerfeldbacteria bacterium]